MDLLTALKERRSINFFDPERNIPESTLRELIEIANLAPSSFNLQPWEVVAVTDPERKKALREHAFNQEKVEEASAVLIVIANPNAVEENVDEVLDSWVELGYNKPEDKAGMRGMPGRMYGAKDSLPRTVFAVKNAGLFAMSLMIAARGLGLETHPMDGFKEAGVKKEFGIPEDRVIPMLIAVGYLKPGVKLLPRAFRRAVDRFTHFNRFRA